METETYKPVRDRGIYRAAANPKSENHKWALDLVNSLVATTPVRYCAGRLKWLYREKGFRNIMKELVYEKNPFMSMLPKQDFSGKYIPVPLKFGKEE